MIQSNFSHVRMSKGMNSPSHREHCKAGIGVLQSYPTVEIPRSRLMSILSVSCPMIRILKNK